MLLAREDIDGGQGIKDDREEDAGEQDHAVGPAIVTEVHEPEEDEHGLHAGDEHRDDDIHDPEVELGDPNRNGGQAEQGCKDQEVGLDRDDMMGVVTHSFTPLANQIKQGKKVDPKDIDDMPI